MRGSFRYLRTVYNMPVDTLPRQQRRPRGTLLPDIMVFQPGLPESYPSNGRSLTDDAAAHFLSIFTDGKVIGDGLKPHTDLLADFPYVGPPH
jgi:hypothetical protein